LSQKPENVQTVINCQNMLFVNNLALSFICYWSHVHGVTKDHISCLQLIRQ